MSEPGVYRSRCQFCGEVTVPTADMRCELDPSGRDALCEFACPICSRLVFARTEALEALALRAAGASANPGRAALEFVEPHAGSPIMWDDVLDAVLALGRTDFPQVELLP